MAEKSQLPALGETAMKQQPAIVTSRLPIVHPKQNGFTLCQHYSTLVNCEAANFASMPIWGSDFSTNAPLQHGHQLNFLTTNFPFLSEFYTCDPVSHHVTMYTKSDTNAHTCVYIFVYLYIYLSIYLFIYIFYTYMYYYVFFYIYPCFINVFVCTGRDQTKHPDYPSFTNLPPGPPTMGTDTAWEFTNGKMAATVPWLLTHATLDHLRSLVSMSKGHLNILIKSYILYVRVLYYCVLMYTCTET